MTPALLTDSVTTDLDRAMRYAGMWGLDALELRTVGGPNVRVPHVDERKLTRRLAEHDVAVAAVDPGLFEGPAGDRVARLNEIAALPDTLAFCARVGCRLVVAASFAAEPELDRARAVDLLRRAGDAAGRRGVTLALRNEHDGAHPTPDDLASLLASTDHEHVRAAYSPADALQAAADPLGLDALAPYVALVRARDGAGIGADWDEATVGEGEIDLAAVLTRLAASGFGGPVSLDVRTFPKPRSGVRGGAAVVQAIRAAQRAHA